MTSRPNEVHGFSVQMLSRRPADIATATAALDELELPLQILSEPSQIEASTRGTEPGPLLLIDVDCAVELLAGEALHRQLDERPPQPRPLMILIGDPARSHPLAARALCTLSAPLQAHALVPVLVIARKLHQDCEQLRTRLTATQCALQQREQLLATLAHEVRNPLCAIQNLVDVLILKPETFNTSVSMLSRQVHHLRGIVDAMYDYRYLSGEPVGDQEQLLDVSELLERGIETVRPKLTARDQRVSLSGQQQPAYVYGHQARLIQVLANLLENAGKYSAPGQTIEARLGAEDDWVVVTIADHGEGIDPEELARIFEPFIQGSQRRREERSGFGLGLAIVREIVTQHGGSVRAMSHGRGFGSTFEVRLPRSTGAPGPGETE